MFNLSGIIFLLLIYFATIESYKVAITYLPTYLVNYLPIYLPT